MEPYGDEIVRTFCTGYRTVWEWAEYTAAKKDAYEKEVLLYRRKRRIAARAHKRKINHDSNLCKTCANNLDTFPSVHCRRHPYPGEENYQDKCGDYHKTTPGELMVFIKFPCGTERVLDWKPDDYKGPFGFTRCGDSRAIKASLIGTTLIDKETLFAAYKFLDQAMHPLNRKIFMNAPVKEAMKGYI
jgi:hypothetical protein